MIKENLSNKDTLLKEVNERLLFYKKGCKSYAAYESLKRWLDGNYILSSDVYGEITKIISNYLEL